MCDKVMPHARQRRGVLVQLESPPTHVQIMVAGGGTQTQCEQMLMVDAGSNWQGIYAYSV